MSFHRRYLNISDILKIAADCSRDDARLRRIKRIDVIQLSNHITCDAETGEYLISIPSEIREELPCLYFFSAGHMFEVHHMSPLPTFSFSNFPKDLVSSRKDVEERLISALIVSRQTMGWFENLQWDELTEEQKNMCRPSFVDDGIAYSPM
jgi:hypothetical protein